MDGFAPVSQRTELVPATRPTVPGAMVDKSVKQRTVDMDRALHHVSYTMLRKCKKIIFNNCLYTLADNETTKWILVRALHRSHCNEPPSVFSEFPDDLLSAVKVKSRYLHCWRTSTSMMPTPHALGM